MIADHRARVRAGMASLLFGLGILGLKFYAYHLTQSTAVLSDALESVVNVVAAGFALWTVRAADAPPDAEHPYGHGKLEFVTAVFEGGLIAFAALLIGYEAVSALLSNPPPPQLGPLGLGVVALTGALNGMLGLFILRTGRRTRSLALEADGKHLLSDFFTTIGLLLGLALVHITGHAWLDPLIALVFAFLLAGTAIPLMRQAMGGLIDSADPELLGRLLVSMERKREPGFIRAHHVRAMRNGRQIHVDGHLVLPDFWSVEEAHDRALFYQSSVLTDLGLEGEIEFHVDPCRRLYCKRCDMPQCPIRREPFVERPPLNLTELTSPVDITDRPGEPQ